MQQQPLCHTRRSCPAFPASAAAVAALPAAAPRQYRQHRHSVRATRNQFKTAKASSSNAAEDPLAALRVWVSDAGGYIDPRLTVADNAPTSGCRGIVASTPISLDDLDTVGPLISVPQQLQFTSSVALGIISQAAGPAAAAAAAEQLLDTQLIAAALAHESCKINNTSSSSFWQPYLSSLPSRPPNPWLLTDPNQVLAAVEAYQQHLSAAAAGDWVAAVAAARQQQLAAAASVEALLGPDLGISQDDVMLALGQVTSRSLVSGSSSGMCPVIDLVNHHASASAPMLQLDDKDQLTMTVLPLREGEAVPMSAGDELLILYKGGYSPLEAFLKFGFAAEEWWQQ